CEGQGKHPQDLADFIPLAGLAESYSAFFLGLSEAKNGLLSGFCVSVGVFDLPDYLAAPRDVLHGHGESITEAADMAYANAAGLYRPIFDFLGAYPGSILERWNSVCDQYGQEPIDVEGEREAGLAKQQASLKDQQDSLAAEQIRAKENFDA